MLYSTHYVTKTYSETFPPWSDQKGSFNDAWWRRLITSLNQLIRRITWFSNTFGKQVCCMHPQCSNQIGQYAKVMPHIWDINTFVGSWLQLGVYFNPFAHYGNLSLKENRGSCLHSQYLDRPVILARPDDTSSRISALWATTWDTRSLIRAFASRLNILWLLSYCPNSIWSF